jgi:Putative porin
VRMFNKICTAISVLSLAVAPIVPASADTERQSLEELRNTVINLLQGLVDQGVLTREKAETIVKQAQEKAAADAAKSAKADEGAVRVPYVPQMIKDEISKQVAEQVKPEVVASVVQEAKTEKWGVPGALPEWLSRVRVYGDVTFRTQQDLFAKDNSAQIPDYFSINQAGSILAAGLNSTLNTTDDTERFRLRARLGVDAQISPTISAGIRLASGALTDPGSESQNLGTAADRYTVGIDRAFIRWDSTPAPGLAAISGVIGRFGDPWYSPTELIFARDLQFEGVSSTGRWGFGSGGDADRSQLFGTLGAFPILEVPLANPENKWLAGGQIGVNLRWDDAQRLKLAVAYYDFLHVTGVQNPYPGSTIYNYTAPAFIRYGNSYFDIANSVNNSTNLYALAAHFRIADIAAGYEVGVGGRYSLRLTAEAVQNIGYNRGEVEALTGQSIAKNENRGYVSEVSFGDPTVNRLGLWRAAIGYRYVQSDAVLDAWTDADFRDGGTNDRGYFLWGDLGIANDTWLRLRYMSANEIDGPTYGLDVIQFDVNTRF